MTYHFNKIAYVSAILFLLCASFLIGCESKKEASEDNMETTKETVLVTEMPSSEWKEYKADAEKSISNNDERIKELKAKIKKPGTPNLDKLREKQINELESRNATLRARIMEFKEDEAHSNWQQFKMDVQKELDEMQKSIDDLNK
jgi:hypothetical protein